MFQDGNHVGVNFAAWCVKTLNLDALIGLKLRGAENVFARSCASVLVGRIKYVNLIPGLRQRLRSGTAKKPSRIFERSIRFKIN